MNTTYNCSFINGTYFNTTEPCYEDNVYNDVQALIFMFLVFGIFCFVCCPRGNNRSSIQIRPIFRRRVFIRQIEPNYSDFLISIDDQLIEDNSVCVICLDDLGNGEDEFSKLEHCEHIFHKKCIKQWLKEKPICPICRTSVFN